MAGPGTRRPSPRRCRRRNRRARHRDPGRPRQHPRIAGDGGAQAPPRRRPRGGQLLPPRAGHSRAGPQRSAVASSRTPTRRAVPCRDRPRLCRSPARPVARCGYRHRKRHATCSRSAQDARRRAAALPATAEHVLFSGSRPTPLFRTVRFRLGESGRSRDRRDPRRVARHGRWRLRSVRSLCHRRARSATAEQSAARQARLGRGLALEGRRGRRRDGGAVSRDPRRAGTRAAARDSGARSDRALLAPDARHAYPAAPRHAQHAAHLSSAADRPRRLRAARRRRNAQMVRGRASDFRRQLRA